MPILVVTASQKHIDIARDDISHLKQVSAAELTVDEWPIDGDHVSVRLNEVVGELIGQIELEIFAHAFKSRVERKDVICSTLRAALEKRWSVEVRVWLHLVEMGYGTKSSTS